MKNDIRVGVLTIPCPLSLPKTQKNILYNSLSFFLIAVDY